MTLNPKSDVGADGIAKWLDAQGIATTQPISRSDTGKEAQSLGRQSTEASPPRATSVFGLKTLILATTLLLVGMPRPGLGQEPNELEQLKATVNAMEQTIQEMKSKIAGLEKQRAMTPGISTICAGAARTGLSTS